MKKIIIVHGWAYTLEKWEPLMGFMKKAGYECELLKVPGLTSKLDRPWTLDDYVQWLDGKVSEKGNILLGHSNGGRIILAYAHRFPEKVDTLILVDSAGVIDRRFKTLIKRAVFGSLAKVGKVFTQSPQLKKVLYALARERDYSEASPIMKKTMVNLITANIEPHLSEIKAPTLIIWGEEDVTTPLKDGKKMHTHLKNSELFTIDGARHSPQFTHSQKVSEIIINYLGKI